MLMALPGLGEGHRTTIFHRFFRTHRWEMYGDPVKCTGTSDVRPAQESTIGTKTIRRMK
jgi:hypothetical protein